MEQILVPTQHYAVVVKIKLVNRYTYKVIRRMLGS